MRRLTVFNQLTLDGYFVDMKGDMSWAHRNTGDPEWSAFVSGNAKGGGALVFGRITYELMASYWPTAQAIRSDPIVAEGMNSMQKVVFSRTMDKASWNNTKLVRGDVAGEVRKMKKDQGMDMVIMGSGSLIPPLTEERLIDEYQVVLIPIVLGAGRTMFEGIREKLGLKLVSTRSFKNGNVFLRYEPA